jgi:hypothetical protein
VIGSTRSVRVFAYTLPIDMRKGFDGLYGLVSTHLGRDPLSGDLFLFERCLSRHSRVVFGSGEEAADIEGGWVDQQGLAVSSLNVGVVSEVFAAVGARAEEGPTVDSSHGQLSIGNGRAIPQVDG